MDLYEFLEFYSSVAQVAKATGKDCGCNKRKETLNRLFPYNQ